MNVGAFMFSDRFCYPSNVLTSSQVDVLPPGGTCAAVSGSEQLYSLQQAPDVLLVMLPRAKARMRTVRHDKGIPTATVVVTVRIGDEIKLDFLVLGWNI